MFHKIKKYFVKDYSFYVKRLFILRYETPYIQNLD